MKIDPVTGPLSQDEFKNLVKAPFGEAVKVIRKFDPQYGRKPGEKFRWKITARCEMEGTAHVMAENEEEANKLADELKDAAFDWDAPWSSDLEIVSIKPIA